MVLRVLGERVKERIEKTKKEPVQSNKSQINFVKEGEKVAETRKADQGSILDSARDWSFSIDLEGRLKIPADITVTRLRPDITITYEKTRQLVMIKLTVPTEDRIEISDELKREKYTATVEEGRQRGCGVSIWAVEVGCRGFPARSMSSLLKALGYAGKERKTAMKKLREEASRAI